MMERAKTTIASFVLSKWLFIAGYALTVLLHAPFLNRPPESAHAWRQALTLGMARNFYQEEMNPFHPRVDNRHSRDGITGSQFPSYEIIVASIYHLTGEQYWVHRCFSLLLYMLGAWGMYRLCWHLTRNPWISRIAFWGFLWSPELFYHGINALPDILALTTSIWGLFYFLRYFLKDKNFLLSESREEPVSKLDLLWAFTLIVLAGLTKLQFLAIGFPIVGFLLIFLRRINPMQWAKLLAFGATVVSIPLLWYRYAIKLIEESGLAEYGLELRPVGNWEEGISILLSNLISDLPEVLLNFANFGLFIIGLFYCLSGKKWRSTLFLPFLLWSVSLITYHLIELSQMKNHAYYMLPYFPVLLPIAGYGAYRLAKASKWWLLFVLIVSQPILASVRVLPARWLNSDKRVPTELYQVESRNRLANAVPDEALTVIGVDQSNCIYFYYLNKKGFGVSQTNQLVTQMSKKSTFLRYYITEGAEYLYLDDKTLLNHPKIQPYIDSVILEEGKFIVTKLKLNK